MLTVSYIFDLVASEMIYVEQYLSFAHVQETPLTIHHLSAPPVARSSICSPDPQFENDSALCPDVDS